MDVEKICQQLNRAYKGSKTSKSEKIEKLLLELSEDVRGSALLYSILKKVKDLPTDEVFDFLKMVLEDVLLPLNYRGEIFEILLQTYKRIPRRNDEEFIQLLEEHCTKLFTRRWYVEGSHRSAVLMLYRQFCKDCLVFKLLQRMHSFIAKIFPLTDLSSMYHFFLKYPSIYQELQDENFWIFLKRNFLESVKTEIQASMLIDDIEKIWNHLKSANFDDIIWKPNHCPSLYQTNSDLLPFQLKDPIFLTNIITHILIILKVLLNGHLRGFPKFSNIIEQRGNKLKEEMEKSLAKFTKRSTSILKMIETDHCMSQFATEHKLEKPNARKLYERLGSEPKSISLEPKTKIRRKARNVQEEMMPFYFELPFQELVQDPESGFQLVNGEEYYKEQIEQLKKEEPVRLRKVEQFKLHFRLSHEFPELSSLSQEENILTPEILKMVYIDKITPEQLYEKVQKQLMLSPSDERSFTPPPEDALDESQEQETKETGNDDQPTKKAANDDQPTQETKDTANDDQPTQEINGTTKDKPANQENGKQTENKTQPKPLKRPSFKTNNKDE